jgi:hypothetical protein
MLTNLLRDAVFPKPLRLLPLLVVPLLAACDSGEPLKWQEEIRLNDKSTVWVERQAEYKAPHEIGQGPAESWYAIDFAHPITGEKVHIEAVMRAGGGEMEQAASQKKLLMQRPIALMSKARELFLVTRSHAQYHEFLHCPDPPYQLYRWSNGSWEWRPLIEIPNIEFTTMFADESDRTSFRTLLEGVHHRLNEQTARTSGAIPSIAYDLRGMRRVTTEPTRYCTRNVEWLTGKNIQN